MDDPFSGSHNSLSQIPTQILTSVDPLQMSFAVQSQPFTVGLSPPLLTQQLPQMDQPFPQAGSQNTRGVWTEYEDELLVRAVSRLGTSRWVDVARLVPSRTAKQCRERWANRLNPTLKREPFEPWEDEIIVNRQKQVGNKWSLIAQALPGRSPGAVKNRWYAGLKGHLLCVIDADLPDIRSVE